MKSAKIILDFDGCRARILAELEIVEHKNEY